MFCNVFWHWIILNHPVHLVHLILMLILINQQREHLDCCNITTLYSPYSLYFSSRWNIRHLCVLDVATAVDLTATARVLVATIYPDLNANIACKKRYNQNRLRLNEITTNGISRQIIDYQSEMLHVRQSLEDSHCQHLSTILVRTLRAQCLHRPKVEKLPRNGATCQ